jgi:hypothetical protein
MTTEDRMSTARANEPADPDAATIKATVWEHFDTGATVVSADGEQIGNRHGTGADAPVP